MPQQLASFPGLKTDYSAVVLDRSLARLAFSYVLGLLSLSLVPRHPIFRARLFDKAAGHVRKIGCLGTRLTQPVLCLCSDVSTACLRPCRKFFDKAAGRAQKIGCLGTRLTQPVLCCFNSVPGAMSHSILRFSLRLLRCLRGSLREHDCAISTIDPRSFTYVVPHILNSSNLTYVMSIKYV